MEFNDYFQAYKNYFWVWEENIEVISIPGGNTIAYREFVLQTLETLAEQGLPPFGSLLLAITATNRAQGDSLQVIRNILHFSPAKTSFNPSGIEQIMQEAFSFLGILSTLPPVYTTGDKRVLLFQTLFESCHNMLSRGNSKELLAKTKQLLKEYKGNLVEQLIRPLEYSHANAHRDLRTIALLSQKFRDTASIIDAMAKIPVIQEPVLPEEPSTPIVPADLTQALIGNPATYPVGSLIKHLWSGLKIPLHHTLPSQQPLGGVSDLTNKGNLDRLLVSEFANDDLLLLSRLANNEALYLNREIPPSADNLERVILLDLSLKSWGIPKILAYAILVAIAHHPKTDIHCSAFAIGHGWQPLEFRTVDQLIDSLKLLQDSLHAASGLELFFKESAHARGEIFLITTQDSFRMPAMQKVISQYHSHFKYWVLTDHAGNIQVCKNQHNSRKLIQQLQLPLEKLWKKKEPGTTTRIPLPSLKGWPILFPPTSGIKAILPLEEETLIVTSEKKVFRQTNTPGGKAGGWQLVLEKVPPGITSYGAGRTAEGELILLFFKYETKEIMILHPVSEEIKYIAFPDYNSSYTTQFFFHDGNFYFRDDEYCWKISPQGKIESQSILKDPDLIKGRYQTFLFSIAKAYAEIGQFKPVLKNINYVCINDNGNLVINKHELVLTPDGIIKVVLTTNTKPAIKTLGKFSDAMGEFTFPDGSTVTTYRSGMVVLRNLIGGHYDDPIFIPAVLNMSLGLSTQKEFAGNMFYYLPKKEAPQTIVAPGVFFEKYIRSFIKRIHTYGTSD